MKKALKIAGVIAGAAALASLLPYSINKDQENDETTVYALLWKYTNKPDYETPGNRKVSIDIGFHNPFKEENEDLLMEDCDEPLLDCCTTVEEVAEPEITEEDIVHF